MRVVFILPVPADVPVGGYKVVYEYANGLVQRGHHVTVVHRYFPLVPGGIVNNAIRRCKWGVLRRNWMPSWFDFDPRVSFLLIPKIREKDLPDADVVFATSWETAAPVAELPARCGVKHYLIQHLETWGGEKERVLDTWRLPLRKFVISRWLEGIAEEIGETSVYMPNGLSQDEFFVEHPGAARDSLTIGTLYHQYKWKGTDDALAAIRVVKEKYPGLKLIMFGAYPEPAGLPDWVEYHYKPSRGVLRGLYNRMSVFVSASWTEGWGLTPCEALMCGAAVAVSDNGGHREFAKDGETALVFPVGDVPAAAKAICRLIEDSDVRRSIVSGGEEMLRRMDWASAVSRFQSELRSCVA